jgi:hypothetical protein
MLNATNAMLLPPIMLQTPCYKATNAMLNATKTNL